MKFQYKKPFIYSIYTMLLFSIINILLYFFIKQSILSNITTKLEGQSKYFGKNYFIKIINSPNNFYNITPNIKIEQIIFTNKLQIGFNSYKNYISYTYPLVDKNLYLKITQNITEEEELIKKLLLILSLIWLIFSFLYLVFRYFEHIRLLIPVNIIIDKLNNMDDNLYKYDEIKNIPFQFEDLVKSINLLLKKIKTSIQYREQLYIGTSHELKTPLSIMKLKTQITLMKIKKNNDFDKNIILESLEQNLISIDNINNIIINILEYGRAESAQFEKPRRMNLLYLIIEKAEEYELLANSQDKNLICHIEAKSFIIKLQPILFIQIFQNLIENSLKFTKIKSTILIHVYINTEYFIIDIIDESFGINEKIDIFAPFIKSRESKGTGLGLFLVKNSAESMGVNVTLKNRVDKEGSIASIKFALSDFLF